LCRSPSRNRALRVDSGAPVSVAAQQVGCGASSAPARLGLRCGLPRHHPRPACPTDCIATAPLSARPVARWCSDRTNCIALSRTGRSVGNGCPLLEPAVAVRSLASPESAVTGGPHPSGVTANRSTFRLRCSIATRTFDRLTRRHSGRLRPACADVRVPARTFLVHQHPCGRHPPLD
jgi:hypothetical protein